MSGWTEFITAFAVFLGAHVVPMRPRLRGWLIETLGRAGYIAAFSALSLGLLYWLIIAAGRAPVVALWDHAEWQRWLVNAAMPVAVFLALFLPGLAGVIVALAIWAAAHLVANGDLAHAIFFGVMLGFALTGLRRLKGASWRITPGRVVTGFAIWALLIWLHPYVIGVSPTP